MSKKRAAQRSYAEWDRLVDEWRASGQTQGQFAEARGINPKAFQGRVWRSRKRFGEKKEKNANLGARPGQQRPVVGPSPELKSPLPRFHTRKSRLHIGSRWSALWGTR